VQHWQAAKTVLRYLAGTKMAGLLYGGTDGLAGEVDADFGGCLKTRRSTTGWVYTLYGATFSCSSKRQATVAASTAEAEYIAATAAAREALWVLKFMADLDLPYDAVPVLEDNNACRAMASNPEDTGRAKHIDIAHHLVRERVATGDIKLLPVTSVEQPADGLTKPRGSPAFDTFRSRFGMANGIRTGAGQDGYVDCRKRGTRLWGSVGHRPDSRVSV